MPSGNCFNLDSSRSTINPTVGGVIDIGPLDDHGHTPSCGCYDPRYGDAYLCACHTVPANDDAGILSSPSSDDAEFLSIFNTTTWVGVKGLTINVRTGVDQFQSIKYGSSPFVQWLMKVADHLSTSADKKPKL
jgi:hypothetical protein